MCLVLNLITLETVSLDLCKLIHIASSPKFVYRSNYISADKYNYNWYYKNII